MSNPNKEFNIPPVVFSSSSSSSSSFPQHRRAAPTPTFTPSNPNPNPNLPFISFDVAPSSSSSSFFSAPVFSSASSDPLSSSFDLEPPLLEELGINTRLIYRKLLSILNPFRLSPDLHLSSADLSGPFLVLLLFGLCQLLAAKFHFGIILGWLIVCSLFVYTVFNMLNGRHGNLDLYTCVSLVGYCMLPMVLFSIVALFVPFKGGVWMMGVGAVFVLWSTRVCTGLLVEVSTGGEEHRGLIGYACFLVYMLFALLVVF